jgi:hypothetical protein
MVDKLQIMLELERRGELPADKQAALTELRSRGAIPALDNAAAGYGSGKAQALANKSMPWFDPRSPGVAKDQPAITPALASAPTAKQPNEAEDPNSPYKPSPLWPPITPDIVRNTMQDAAKNPPLIPMAGVGAAADQTLPMLTDLVSRKIPNVAKTVAGKIGNFGQFPQRLASRYLNRPPNSVAVDTMLDKGIPITGGKTADTTKAMANKAWEPVPPLIDEATRAGKTISKSVLQEAGQAKLDKIASKTLGGKESPEYQKAAEYLQILEKEANEIPIDRAEKLKEGLNKQIRDWAASDVKDEALRPVISTKKALKRSLPNAIAEQTSNPEAVLTANEEYGNLAKLLNKRGEFSPAERADNYASKQGLYRRSMDSLEEMLSKGLYKMQKAGDSVVPPTPPTDGPLQDMFRQLPGGKTPPPAAPGSAAGGWEQAAASGSVGDDFHPSNGSFRPKTHPDWFEGLEPSTEAKNLGKQVDWQDYNAFQKGDMSSPVEISPRTAHPGLPPGTQRLALPAETSEAKNAPSMVDFGVKGLHGPGYQNYTPSVETLGTPIQPQKLLPAPAAASTPTGAILTNEDLAGLQNAGHINPMDYMNLKRLLGIQ